MVLKKLKDLTKTVPHIIVHSKNKSIYLNEKKIIEFKYSNKIYEKLNILGAGDNFASCIFKKMTQ